MRSLHISTKSSPRSLQLEKVHEEQRRPNAAKKEEKKENITKNQSVDQLHIASLHLP